MGVFLIIQLLLQQKLTLLIVDRYLFNKPLLHLTVVLMKKMTQTLITLWLRVCNILCVTDVSDLYWCTLQTRYFTFIKGVLSNSIRPRVCQNTLTLLCNTTCLRSKAYFWMSFILFFADNSDLWRLRAAFRCDDQGNLWCWCMQKLFQLST